MLSSSQGIRCALYSEDRLALRVLYAEYSVDRRELSALVSAHSVGRRPGQALSAELLVSRERQ